MKRVTGYEIEGKAKEADGFIHLINSGAACLDANGESKDADGNNVMKAWYDVTEEDQDAMLKATLHGMQQTMDTSVEADSLLVS